MNNSQPLFIHLSSQIAKTKTVNAKNEENLFKIFQARTCVHMLHAALSLLIFNFEFFFLLMHARNMNIKHSFYSEIFFFILWRIYNSSCTECILQINIFSNSKMWKLKINSLNSCFSPLHSSYTFQYFSVFLHNKVHLCIHFWLGFVEDEKDFRFWLCWVCFLLLHKGEMTELCRLKWFLRA